MAKLLSKREMELFHRVVSLAARLERCEPREVGMGPTRQMLAEEQANALSFEIDPDDIAEVCETVEGS